MVNLTNSGRQINVSQRELLEIKSIYESVMNLAANGLFFRAGQVLGRGVADRAEEMGGNLLEAASRIITDEGWVSSARLDREQAVVEGCIEVRQGVERSCNLLRGILAEVYARHYQTKLFCHEIECAGTGGPKCVFQIRKGVL